MRFIKALSLLWWLGSVHFCRVRIAEIPGQSEGTAVTTGLVAQLSPDTPPVNTPQLRERSARPDYHSRQPAFLFSTIQTIRQSHHKRTVEEDRVEDRGQSEDRK